jgi:hypothetical protein
MTTSHPPFRWPPTIPAVSHSTAAIAMLCNRFSAPKRSSTSPSVPCQTGSQDSSPRNHSKCALGGRAQGSPFRHFEIAVKATSQNRVSFVPTSSRCIHITLSTSLSHRQMSTTHSANFAQSCKLFSVPTITRNHPHPFGEIVDMQNPSGGSGASRTPLPERDPMLGTPMPNIRARSVRKCSARVDMSRKTTPQNPSRPPMSLNSARCAFQRTAV